MDLNLFVKRRGTSAPFVYGTLIPVTTPSPRVILPRSFLLNLLNVDPYNLRGLSLLDSPLLLGHTVHVDLHTNLKGRTGWSLSKE